VGGNKRRRGLDDFVAKKISAWNSKGGNFHSRGKGTSAGGGTDLKPADRERTYGEMCRKLRMGEQPGLSDKMKTKLQDAQKNDRKVNFTKPMRL